MTVSIEVHDAHSGMPVAQLPVRFERRADDGWEVVACHRTDTEGRVAKWEPEDDCALSYRCVLDTDRYFTGLGLNSFYPEIIVALRLSDRDPSLRVTVLAAAHAYLVQNEYG
ncbi:hydroxyisourate hydrolase [Phytomonospora sp. NPDC050363]|uniref:hydroxyisourate hydrolase n=1 Tax=Phytomonospora sp. NPDC050363 TaxID=3155642 RepID=UPI0033F4D1DF